MKGFNRNLKYMCAGIYVYDESIKYLIRNDENTKLRAKQIFQNNYYPSLVWSIIFLLRKILFSKSVVIPKQDELEIGFSGTVYRPVRSSTGYSDSRIFDLSRNQVLTVFSKEEDYSSVVLNCEHFREYFPMPSILYTDPKGLLIIEELIQFEQNHTWGKADYMYIMEDILKRNIEYAIACKETGVQSYVSPSELFTSLPAWHEINFIRDKINPILLDEKFPRLKLHGDLWTSNTLLVKRETHPHQVYYIDWEYSDELIFFYDLFNMMWLEAYVNNNFFYIESYVNGHYDSYFTKLFSIYNLSFQTERKLDFLYIYFVDFYQKRVVNMGKADRLDFLNQFKRLIERIGDKWGITITVNDWSINRISGR